MDNVNNLNGVPNFGHGSSLEEVLNDVVEPTLDTQVPEPTLHKSKVRSVAQKALGGRYK